MDEFFTGFSLPDGISESLFRKTKTQKRKKGSFLIGWVVRNGLFLPYYIHYLDFNFPLKFYIEGEAGFGKSVLSRVIEETGLLDYLERRIPHPIFHIDFKGNYLGFGEKNRNPKHLAVLKKRFSRLKLLDMFRKMEVPFKKNIFVPAYAVPVESYRSKEMFEDLQRRYGATHLWRMNWRTIFDLEWLTNLFGFSGNTVWINKLKPAFHETVMNKDFTFERLIEKEGFLESKAQAIDNDAMRKASMRFIEILREQRYLFGEEDTFAINLKDDFSYNVLTFKPTYSMKTMNQWSFIIALQEIIKYMQHSEKKSQPIFIFSDVQIPAGNEAVSAKQASRAILEVFDGFGRSGNVGFVLVIEAHNRKQITESLRPKRERYTHMIKLSPFTRSERSAKPRLIRGKGKFKDYFLNETEDNVYFRPPFTNYTG